MSERGDDGLPPPADMSKQVPWVTLNDGVQMPQLGFGTSGINVAATETGGTAIDLRQEPAYEAIKWALRCGYRFFDTAALYGNEQLVGLALNDAISERLVERSELFVCTKVWNTAHKRRSVQLACRDSLKRLKLTYVDLYLIHWPCAYADYYEQPAGAHDFDWINPRKQGAKQLDYSDTHFTETWLGMQDVQEAGLARSIGLSNFNHKMIDQIYAMPGFKRAPSVNQVEMHPYLSQQALLDYSKQRNILLNAYCPLGAPNANWLPPPSANQPAHVFEDALIKQLARKYSKTQAQIILRFHLERGVAPIPKSVTKARIAENICGLFDFELEPSDMARLLALNRNKRYCVNTAGELIHDHPLYPFNEPY